MYLPTFYTHFPGPGAQLSSNIKANWKSFDKQSTVSVYSCVGIGSESRKLAIISGSLIFVNETLRTCAYRIGKLIITHSALVWQNRNSFPGLWDWCKWKIGMVGRYACINFRIVAYCCTNNITVSMYACMKYVFTGGVGYDRPDAPPSTRDVEDQESKVG